MKKIDTEFEFNLCIPVEVLIDFISTNTGWDWNRVCEMEYLYRKKGDFENDRAYPIVLLNEKDDTKFHYWAERFLETYQEEIWNKTVYVIHD